MVSWLRGRRHECNLFALRKGIANATHRQETLCQSSVSATRYALMWRKPARGPRTETVQAMKLDPSSPAPVGGAPAQAVAPRSLPHPPVGGRGRGAIRRYAVPARLVAALATA